MDMIEGLLGADGLPIHLRQQTPDFDPKFLFSMAQQRGDSGSMARAVRERPYQHYTWVYACASVIAINASALPVCLFTDQDMKTKVKEHALLKLLRRPNPYMTRSQFIEAIFLGLLLPTTRTPGGQVFLVGDKPKGSEACDFGLGELPDELYPFTDEVMFAKVVEGVHVGWELRIPGSEPLLYRPWEVVRIHLYNPYNMLLGMSPYAAAAMAADSDVKLSELGTRFAENNANIGGVLTTEKSLTKPQADDLKQRWSAAYEGVDKSGRTALLHSGLTYQATAQKMADMQAVDQKKMKMDEVLAAYKVSKFMLGLYDTIDEGTAAAAKKSFWQETVIPLIKKAFESVNSRWVEHVDRKNYTLFPDVSTIDALKPDLKDKINAADVLIRQGTPPVEAYRLLEIPVDSDNYPWLKLPLVQGSRVNLADGTILGESQLFGGAPEAALPEIEAPKEETPEENPKLPPSKEPTKSKSADGVILQVDERTKVWIEWVTKSLKAPERAWKDAMVKLFTSQRNRMEDLVDEWLSQQKHLKRDANLKASDFLLTRAGEDKLLKEAAKPLYHKSVESQAAKVSSEIGDLVNWNINSPYVDKFLRSRLTFITQVNLFTNEMARDAIGTAITEGVSQNMTIPELGRKIKDAIKDTMQSRVSHSQTIARTETATISSQTRQSIFEKEGILRHEWLTARDESVRDGEFDHKHADGEIVEVGKSFSTGLRHPSDPHGAAGNIINCRCVALAVKDD